MRTRARIQAHVIDLQVWAVFIVSFLASVAVLSRILLSRHDLRILGAMAEVSDGTKRAPPRSALGGGAAAAGEDADVIPINAEAIQSARDVEASIASLASGMDGEDVGEGGDGVAKVEGYGEDASPTNVADRGEPEDSEYDEDEFESLDDDGDDEGADPEAARAAKVSLMTFMEESLTKFAEMDRNLVPQISLARICLLPGPAKPSCTKIPCRSGNFSGCSKVPSRSSVIPKKPPTNWPTNTRNICSSRNMLEFFRVAAKPWRDLARSWVQT